MPAPRRPRVILRRCPDYDVPRMRGIVREGIADLGIAVRGPVFVKPNIVSANRKYIHASYTNPAAVEAAVGVLLEHAPGAVTIGESGGYWVPSRLFFRESGYTALAGRLGVPLADLNEERAVRVPLARGVCHRDMLVAEPLYEAATKVWMPKLKFHIFASITHAVKLNVGILQHRERMHFHDHRVHEKIVDLLEVGYPDLVIGDAVDITYGFESAPYPVRLGMMMTADHPLAADVVAAHVMGYDPREVRHLAIAAERGYGSLDLADISVEGDVGIEELAAKPKGDRRFVRVLEELDTPIRFHSGFAPGTRTVCDGGCRGAVQGCVGTIEKRSPGALAKAGRGAIVTGVYEGDVIEPEHPVLLVGDCTRVVGRLEAKRVVRVAGCPVAAMPLITRIPWLFKLPSPMLDVRDGLLFAAYFLARAWKQLRLRFRPPLLPRAAPGAGPSAALPVPPPSPAPPAPSVHP